MSVEELRDELDEHQEDVEQVDDTETDYDKPTDDDDDSGEQGADDAADNQDDDDSETLDFSFDDDGDEKDPYAGQAAPDWVKEQRKENRELKRQLAELQKQHGKPEQQGLRAKPTLDDHDYQDNAYAADLEKWFEEKQQHEAKVQAEQQKYQHYRDRYKADVDAVKAKASDYDDVEQSVADALSESKQGLLQMLVEHPAKMAYALGKNSPAQLKRLSKLDDMQFAKQIVLMELEMSSNSKSRNPNKPKPKTHSLEGAAGGGDAQLAKLEAEADRTGDRSKVTAYKKSLRQKG